MLEPAPPEVEALAADSHVDRAMDVDAADPGGRLFDVTDPHGIPAILRTLAAAREEEVGDERDRNDRRDAERDGRQPAAAVLVRARDPPPVDRAELVGVCVAEVVEVGVLVVERGPQYSQSGIGYHSVAGPGS
jgi:hypothetical protein